MRACRRWPRDQRRCTGARACHSRPRHSRPRTPSYPRDRRARQWAAAARKGAQQPPSVYVTSQATQLAWRVRGSAVARRTRRPPRWKLACRCPPSAGPSLGLRAEEAMASSLGWQTAAAIRCLRPTTARRLMARRSRRWSRTEPAAGPRRTSPSSAPGRLLVRAARPAHQGPLEGCCQVAGWRSLVGGRSLQEPGPAALGRSRRTGPPAAAAGC